MADGSFLKSEIGELDEKLLWKVHKGYEVVEQLFIRPLSSITEEEKIELLLIIGEPKMYAAFDFRIGDEMHYLNLVGESGVIIIGFNPESVKYLLSKHFDLFGLIEAGLAIDKTVLK